jgi:general secretion pathway protein L
MTIFIRPELTNEEISADDYSWEWIGDEITYGKGELATCAEIVKEHHADVVVLLPGEQVLLTTAVVPSRQPRQIMQALPYIVEEKISVDVDTCHFALGQKNNVGAYSVAVTDLEKIRALLAMLLQKGIKPAFVTADTLLAHHNNRTTVTVEGERAHIRLEDGSGFSLPSEQMAFAIDLLEEPGDIDVHLPSEYRERLNIQIAQLQATSTVSVVEEPDEGLALLMPMFDQQVLNLMQGEFETKREISNGALVWKSAAILVVSTFLLHISLLLGQGIYLDLAGDQYAQEVDTLYAEVFPNDRNVRDVRRRWGAHINGGGGLDDGEFLSLFRETAAQLPGSKLTVNNINYNESRGDLILQLTAAQSGHLVSFSELLNKIGLQAEIGTISQQDDSVRGSVKIKSFGGAS